jgi:hypothetical protein
MKRLDHYAHFVKEEDIESADELDSICWNCLKSFYPEILCNKTKYVIEDRPNPSDPNLKIILHCSGHWEERQVLA